MPPSRANGYTGTSPNGGFFSALREATLAQPRLPALLAVAQSARMAHAGTRPCGQRTTARFHAADRHGLGSHGDDAPGGAGSRGRRDDAVNGGIDAVHCSGSSVHAEWSGSDRPRTSVRQPGDHGDRTRRRLRRALREARSNEDVRGKKDGGRNRSVSVYRFPGGPLRVKSAGRACASASAFLYKCRLYKCRRCSGSHPRTRDVLMGQSLLAAVPRFARA